MPEWLPDSAVATLGPGEARMAGVSVTGSERAGSAVASVAGQNLKKGVPELGGSDPFIVLDGADLPNVAKTAAAARMENGGQACSASNRMIVTDAVYDDFMREFTAAMSSYVTGDPTDLATSYGPLSSEQAARNLMAQIDDRSVRAQRCSPEDIASTGRSHSWSRPCCPA